MFEQWTQFVEGLGKTAFKAKIATWTTLVALSSFGLGAAARQEWSAEAERAQALGAAGEAEGAIQVLAQANTQARGTLDATLAEGLQDADRRSDDALALLERQSRSLSPAELQERVDDVARVHALHRKTIHDAYMRTLRRERLQLEAISQGWDAEGQALAQARIQELVALEREISTRLLDADSEAGVAKALAVDTTPTSVEARAEREDALPKIQGHGLVKQLEQLSGDSVAATDPAEDGWGEWSEWSDAWGDDEARSDWSGDDWDDATPAAGKATVDLPLGSD